MIHPVDPEDVNTLVLADTKEEAIERIYQMHAWGSLGPGEMPTVMVLRDRVPLWFGHLVQETIFEFLAYKEYRK